MTGYISHYWIIPDRLNLPLSMSKDTIGRCINSMCGSRLLAIVPIPIVMVAAPIVALASLSYFKIIQSQKVSMRYDSAADSIP